MPLVLPGNLFFPVRLKGYINRKGSKFVGISCRSGSTSVTKKDFSIWKGKVKGEELNDLREGLLLFLG